MGSPTASVARAEAFDRGGLDRFGLYDASDHDLRSIYDGKQDFDPWHLPQLIKDGSRIAFELGDCLPMLKGLPEQAGASTNPSATKRLKKRRNNASLEAYDEYDADEMFSLLNKLNLRLIVAALIIGCAAYCLPFAYSGGAIPIAVRPLHGTNANQAQRLYPIARYWERDYANMPFSRAALMFASPDYFVQHPILGLGSEYSECWKSGEVLSAVSGLLDDLRLRRRADENLMFEIINQDSASLPGITLVENAGPTRRGHRCGITAISDGAPSTRYLGEQTSADFYKLWSEASSELEAFRKSVVSIMLERCNRRTKKVPATQPR